VDPQDTQLWINVAQICRNVTSAARTTFFFSSSWNKDTITFQFVVLLMKGGAHAPHHACALISNHITLQIFSEPISCKFGVWCLQPSKPLQCCMICLDQKVNSIQQNCRRGRASKEEHKGEQVEGQEEGASILETRNKEQKKTQVKIRFLIYSAKVTNDIP